MESQSSSLSPPRWQAARLFRQATLGRKEEMLHSCACLQVGSPSPSVCLHPLPPGSGAALQRVTSLPHDPLTCKWNYLPSFCEWAAGSHPKTFVQAIPPKPPVCVQMQPPHLGGVLSSVPSAVYSLEIKNGLWRNSALLTPLLNNLLDPEQPP